MCVMLKQSGIIRMSDFQHERDLALKIMNYYSSIMANYASNLETSADYCPEFTVVNTHYHLHCTNEMLTPFCFSFLLILQAVSEPSLNLKNYCQFT